MRTRYSVNLIKNYINGDEITDYDIDTLEDDCQFMMSVIFYSKDKKIYKLCSDRVKKNYEFVKFIIKFFKEDKKFIKEVAENYLDSNCCDETNERELVIIMSDLLKKEDDSYDFIGYRLMAQAFYNQKILEYSLISENLEDSELKVAFGMGFWMLEEEYGTSKVIKDYFAQNMVEEIFYYNKEGLSLEELLHKKFKRFDSLAKYGVNNFIIKYVSLFDINLSNYIRLHPRLINSLKEAIKKIGKNWDNYKDIINERRILIYEQELRNFMTPYHGYIRFDIHDYVVKKLNLVDIFTKYDNFNYFGFDEENIKSLDGGINFSEAKCIKYAIDLAKNLFKEDVIDKTPNDYKENNEKAQILKFVSNYRKA